MHRIVLSHFANGIRKGQTMTKEKTKTPIVLSAGSLTKNPVKNSAGEHIGNVEELMIDYEVGRISYAVISFGGLFGINSK